jgi:hypothetical protein
MWKHGNCSEVSTLYYTEQSISYLYIPNKASYLSVPLNPLSLRFIQIHSLRLIQTAQAPFSTRPTRRNVVDQPGAD